MSDIIDKLERTINELSVPEKHQLAIAKKTLKMSDAGAKIMGGMTKEEARKVIKKLTGKTVKEGTGLGMYSVYDNIVDPVTIKDIIDAVYSNIPSEKIDEKAVKKEFEDILKTVLKDARFMIKKHAKSIAISAAGI